VEELISTLVEYLKSKVHVPDMAPEPDKMTASAA
jgi:hypothetical protein